MAQKLNLKISGLYTNPNQLSEVPEGALIEAKNVVIDRGGVLESRRGQYIIKTFNNPVKQIYEFQNKLIVWNGNKLSYQLNSNYDFQDYNGNYFGFSGLKIKSTFSNKNIYFATITGVKKLSSITDSTLSDSGIFKALDGTAVSVSASGTGWLQHNEAVAYRIVWGFRDSNNNLLLGSPSGRTVVSGTGSSGSFNVSLTYQIPDAITSEYFYQIYRSSIVDKSIEPSDDLQLVYEGIPSALEISNLEFTITDITDPILMGAYLYTSPGQEGILQANEQPPLCKDICTFKNMTFFANTKTRQRLFATLIASGSPNGIQIGDSITINSETFNAVSSTSPGTNQFTVFTSSPDPAENIRNTAKSLIYCVNKYSSTINGFYLSGYNELPGKILFETLSTAANEFTFSCSRTGVFTPINSANLITSSNDEFPNRVFFSKLQQPESVPIVNYLDCGSANEEIIRIIPLKDSVFVLKQYSIYRIIGEDPFSLRVSLFDNAINFSGADTAVLVDSTIYCDTDQGLTSISDNGIQVLSRPIENLISDAKNIQDFETSAFGVGYDFDRKYLLFVKKYETDTQCTRSFVYNYFTNAWTEWELERSCGLVGNNNLLYMGDVNGNLYIERRNYNIADYADNEFNVTIISYSGLEVTISDASDLHAGMILEQVGQYSVILDIVGNILTVENLYSWQAGSAIVYDPINIYVEWSQQSAENPGILKHWREVSMFFRFADFETFNIGFRSNFSNEAEFIEIQSNESLGTWGEFTWGESTWGEAIVDNYVVRTYVPKNLSRAHILYPIIKNGKGRSRFAFQGISLIFENMSERFKNGSITSD